MKGVNELKADELLLNLTSFRKISERTGWKSVQILNYIDNVFRYEHPEFYIENISYFCWGSTNSELSALNKKSYIKYIEAVKAELLALKSTGKEK